MTARMIYYNQLLGIKGILEIVSHTYISSSSPILIRLSIIQEKNWHSERSCIKAKVMINRAKHINPVNIITNTSKKIIGTMIKTIREEKKITQSQLAGLLNIDRQYIWRIERGIINLTMDYLDKIILALDCSHKDFFLI